MLAAYNAHIVHAIGYGAFPHSLTQPYFSMCEIVSPLYTHARIHTHTRSVKVVIKSRFMCWFGAWGGIIESDLFQIWRRLIKIAPIYFKCLALHWDWFPVDQSSTVYGDFIDDCSVWFNDLISHATILLCRFFSLLLLPSPNRLFRDWNRAYPLSIINTSSIPNCQMYQCRSSGSKMCIRLICWHEHGKVKQ